MASWCHEGGIGCLLAAFTYKAGARKLQAFAPLMRLSESELLKMLQESAVLDQFDTFSLFYGMYMPYLLNCVVTTELMDLSSIEVLVDMLQLGKCSQPHNVTKKVKNQDTI